MDKNLRILARDCLRVSWWSVKRAHLAGFRNGGGEIRVAEQCRRRRCLPSRFRQDCLPYLPHPLASEFQLAVGHTTL
jgi:hypothetical protein